MSPNVHIKWKNLGTGGSREYTCGYCGKPLASEKCYVGDLTTGVRGEILTGQAHVYVCHFCTRPTYFDPSGAQVPGVCFGNDVAGIDDDSVRDLYGEARRATGANCYTASVLCCRKLLMHVAVHKGAKKGENFASYVEYLGKNYVTPNSVGWVDRIRDKGNEANHEIMIAKPDDAKELLAFVEMLLKLIYEFPAMQKKHSSSTTL
jgi:hypothetical protein